MQPTKALVSLRYVTRIVAVIILIMVAVGFFLPSDYKIERSVVVDRENQNELLERLYTVEAWPSWMYIQDGQLQLSADTHSESKLDQNVEFGILYIDNPNKRGSITVQSVSDTKIDFTVTPNQTVKPISNAIEITQQNEHLVIVWVVEGVLDAGFLSPYLALIANSIAGSNLEKSLASLAQF